MVSCRWCSGEISTRGAKIFCSRRCVVASRSTRSRQICVICGKAFSTKNTKKTCSEICRCISIGLKRNQNIDIDSLINFYHTNPTEVENKINETGGMSAAARYFSVSVYIMRNFAKRQKLNVHVDGRKRPPRILETSEECKEFIDGMLLSDASIGNVESNSAALSLKTPHKEYAQYIFDKLTSYGIKCKLDIYEIIDKRLINGSRFDVFAGKKTISYQVRTLNYDYFRKEYDRWYYGQLSKRGYPTKRVPRDLRNTPVMWNMEHCGDGNLYLRFKENSGQVTLATNSYPMEDVEYLVELLKKYNVVSRPIVRKHGDIVLSIYSAAPFIKLCGNSPTPFFDYKFAIISQCIQCNKTYFKFNTDKDVCYGCYRKISRKRYGYINRKV